MCVSGGGWVRIRGEGVARFISMPLSKIKIVKVIRHLLEKG